jgi:hypothetical protein
MGDSKLSFFILDIILLFVFIGLTLMIFNLKRIPFIGELFIVITLLFLAFIALMGVYNNNNWAYALLSWVFAAVLVDLLLIYYLKRNLSDTFIVTTALSALGFVITVASIKKKEVKEEVIEEEDVVKTEFKPGKFIASKTGKSYHSPKCDWAKKIKNKNKVWFDDEKEAKKSYKAHSCLKNKVYKNF